MRIGIAGKIVVFAVAVLLFGNTLSWGEEQKAVEGKAVSYPHQAGRKLSRGATNIARSVTEFYVQPMEAKWSSGKTVSAFWPGLGEAFGMFLTRVIGGTLEVMTFAVPFPNGWQPLLDE